jgi:ribosomal protein S18 acetylase RimI-like enzyme
MPAEPPTVTLSNVTTADGATLAANSIPAFWADPHWRLEWRHRTLDYHISQVALRYPRNLLRNRATARHQKAVDASTGKIVGYARWSLPEGHSSAWPEAVVPSVSAEEEADIVRVAESAVWDPDWSSDPLLDKVREVEGEMLARGVYMSVFSLWLSQDGNGWWTAALDYLAVHPDQQRRGIATALIRSGMQQAEKLGLDIFVHAMKPGVKVYQRLGFRMEREIIQDDSKYGGPGLFGDYFLVYEQHRKTEE